MNRDLPINSAATWPCPENVGYLSMNAIAEFLDVKPPTVYSWVYKGSFPAPVMFGPNTYRWPIGVLRDWLATRLIGPPCADAPVETIPPEELAAPEKSGCVASRHGSENYRANLTEAQVLAIRADKRSMGSIGRDYGVSRNSVWNIKHRKTWKHI